jgi:Tfp pilus assembly protein PilO
MEALLKNTSPRTHMLLMASLAVLLLAALAGRVVWPQYRHYSQSRNTLQMLESVMARGDGLDRKMQALQEQVAALNHRLHGDMVDLPQNQMESFIIGRLQKISWRNHIELDSVRPGNGSKVQAFEEIQFDVRISGDYFDIYQWLQDMRNELGYVVVKQFDIRRSESGSASRQLHASFTIVAFRDTGHA